MQFDIKVTEKEIRNVKKYKDTVIMSYSIKYPQFESASFVRILRNINNFYAIRARDYAARCERRFYRIAVEQYEQSLKQRFPMRKFEMEQIFSVTYNKNCALSLYIDQYEYTGGAHGATDRRSDTWDLNRNMRMELPRLFPYVQNVKEYILQDINSQIEEQMQSHTGMYFDEYRKEAEETFNRNGFYVADDGVVFYFQQYDIAPYASGIPEFLIRYAKGGATEPVCYNRNGNMQQNRNQNRRGGLFGF